MPPTGKLEFPNGTPSLYKAMWGITLSAFAANWLIQYLVAKRWSVTVADKIHPDTIRIDGTVMYVSIASHRLYLSAITVVFVTILATVGLGVYYRFTGVSTPGLGKYGAKKITTLDI